VKRSSKLLVTLLAATLVACSKPAPDAAHVDRDPLRCSLCHTPEFSSTDDPPHAGARPATCGVCHTQSSWGHVRIEHPWWALTGAHARAAEDRTLAGTEHHVKCFWCHRGEPAIFAGTKKECIACHEDDRRGVTFPEHDSFAQNCELCHSTEAWKPASRPPSQAAIAQPESPARLSPPAPQPREVPPSPAVRATPPPPTHAPSLPAAPTTRPKPAPLPAPDVVSHATRRH
jgi:hypothetical protein